MHINGTAPVALRTWAAMSFSNCIRNDVIIKVIGSLYDMPMFKAFVITEPQIAVCLPAKQNVRVAVIAACHAGLLERLTKTPTSR
jgi:hypothetical protein